MTRPTSGVTMLLLLVSCAPDQPHAPVRLLEAALTATPMCQAGCVEPDPAPSAPGIFRGSSVTPEACFDPGLQTDSDRDQLSDYCERVLAAAFAPELAYASVDDVRGEPRWVAQPWGEGVAIGYLFAYYTDFGSESTLQCKLRWPIPILVYLAPCGGHNGDSEQVLLLLRNDSATEHWVLSAAEYFQHTGSSWHIGPEDGYAPLEYPVHPGSHPVVYVAMRKHASYPTRQACDAGGTAGSDDCSGVDRRMRVAAGASQNIGSRSTHTASQDSTRSTNSSYQHYGGGRYETFWTSKPFRGWVPDSVGGGQSDSYSERLALMGF